MLTLVPPEPARPESVAILGLGPSVHAYLDLTRRLGGRRKLADETWCINALGNVLDCDRIFHMDDVRIQQVRAAALPESNIAVMLDWMKDHPGPIYTSRTHPDFPGLVQFPMAEVLGTVGIPYFNSTAAYAVAMAIHMRVKTIFLYGIDYTYANSHSAEKGRGCVEFWLGIAYARGIEINIAEQSSLMDMCDGQPIYGYGRMGSLDLDIQVGPDPAGPPIVNYIERPELPTAAEIEAEYDHTKHPSSLVSGKAA